LSSTYRYIGWDSKSGGYRLRVTPSTAPEMILPYEEEEAVLVDARHAEPSADGPVDMPSPPAPVAEDDTLADWLNDIATGRSQMEAPLIANSKGKAVRDGAQLSIKLTEGRTLTLSDDLACGQVACPPQVFRSFDYAGQSPDGRYHVIAQRWDEASAALLVDVTSGAIVSLVGLPKFSPDGRRAVASVTDLEWSAPRRLEVWKIADGAPTIEFSLRPPEEEDTVYDVIGWRDSDHINLRRGPWAGDQRENVTLAHDASGWHIETTGSAE
jgi:hypothetical protein